MQTDDAAIVPAAAPNASIVPNRFPKAEINKELEMRAWRSLACSPTGPAVSPLANSSEQTRVLIAAMPIMEVPPPSKRS